MRAVFAWIKGEAVLTVALVLAILSCCFIPPDRAYLSYIDFRTLALLFCLMAIVSGLRRLGLLERLGYALLRRVHRPFRMVLVLMSLCFFCSMLITNDVALLTFVPFTFVVLGLLEEDTRRRLLLPVVCIQTLAANLGSMLTPLGNPQNLYLYSKSGLSFFGFLRLMFPYTLVSLLLLILWCRLLCRKQETLSLSLPNQKTDRTPAGLFVLYGVLFVLCLLVVLRILPYPIVFGIVLLSVLLFDRKALAGVDYSLLLTFVGFFIFIGNLGRLPAFSDWLQAILIGHEVPVAVLTSQITSNVPAALLLSGFTKNTAALIIGTDLGGLGTLIASMASLISYRQIARMEPKRKGAYFRLFTGSNVLFLAVLLGVWWGITN